MTRRERIFQKYGGLCAYSGTPLEPDWQIDHIEPVVRINGKPFIPFNDIEDNMVPCQKVINNYKFSYSLMYFRLTLLGKLHIRLRKYPHSGKGGERRKRMERIAEYFGITPERPFSGTFYFETMKTASDVNTNPKLGRKRKSIAALVDDEDGDAENDLESRGDEYLRPAIDTQYRLVTGISEGGKYGYVG